MKPGTKEPWSRERLLALTAGSSRLEFEREHAHLWLVRPLSASERVSPGFNTVAVHSRPKVGREPGAPPGIASAMALLLADPHALGLHPVKKQQGHAWSDRLHVGRAANNDIVIRDDGVSKLHAWFQHNADEARLFDAKSSNGTWVDGVRVGDSGTVVQSGSSLRLGRLWAFLIASGPLWDELSRLRRQASV